MNDIYHTTYHIEVHRSGAFGAVQPSEFDGSLCVGSVGCGAEKSDPICAVRKRIVAPGHSYESTAEKLNGATSPKQTFRK